MKEKYTKRFRSLIEKMDSDIQLTNEELKELNLMCKAMYFATTDILSSSYKYHNSKEEN